MVGLCGKCMVVSCCCFFILNRILKGQQVNLALGDSVSKISPVLFNEIIVDPSLNHQ